MSNLKKIIIWILIGAGVVLVLLGIANNITPIKYEQSFGGVSNYVDTEASGMTQTTSTVNTTSTQIFASVSKWSEIINNTTSTVTCSLDATGTTAASSAVASGRGVIIGPNNGTLIASSASFGECYPGSRNCYPHKGAVNCLADVARAVDKIVR